MFWGKVGRITISNVWHEATPSTVHPHKNSTSEAEKHCWRAFSLTDV